MIVYVFVYVVLLSFVLYLVYCNRELFTSNSANFIEEENSEFRGINLLGLNSDDGHFASQNADVCRELCQRNPECKGYSFYKPGQRCYMFTTGDFVGGRPGFYSGKKISAGPHL